MKRKNFNPKGLVIKIIIGLFISLFVIAFNWISYSSADQAVKYKNIESTVEVEAAVSRCEKYYEYDIDGNKSQQWKTYISYEYNGEFYEVWYGNFGLELEKGFTIIIDINPELPGEIAPDETDNSGSLVYGTLFMIIEISVLYWFISSYVPKSIGLVKSENKGIFSKIAIGIIVIKQVVESIIFYTQKNSLIYGVFSIIAVIVVLLVIALISSKKKRAIKAASSQVE